MVATQKPKRRTAPQSKGKTKAAEKRRSPNGFGEIAWIGGGGGFGWGSGCSSS
jgi:hypothetical protein